MITKPLLDKRTFQRGIFFIIAIVTITFMIVGTIGAVIGIDMDKILFALLIFYGLLMSSIFVIVGFRSIKQLKELNRVIDSIEFSS